MQKNHQTVPASLVMGTDDLKQSCVCTSDGNVGAKHSTYLIWKSLSDGDIDKDSLLRWIESDVIGHNAIVETPFGLRDVVYADFTASGRALESFENFLRAKVLPMYANTHSTSSSTGIHTTHLREEARKTILSCCGGESGKDSVILAGTGCTGAIMKLVNLLRRSHEWRNCIDSGCQPLVLIGPYEHHSNILPWRESGAEVVTVRESSRGGVEMRHLQILLEKAADRTLKIGSFSAVSNITGILSDTVALSVMLHRYGALAFFDYASGGPYVELDMNPASVGIDPGLSSKDAIFISPHKFIGGVSTPGVLVLKNALYKRFSRGCAPANPGGGTVLFVTEDNHQYLDDVTEREEGGTPDIVGSVRCGMTFLLKDAVGHKVIMKHEDRHWQYLRDAFAEHRNIEILGNQDCPRLAIVSFMIKHGKQYLHHNFVASLLNDLFGVQVRAGCACAGPYAQRLFGIDTKLAALYGAALLQGHNVLKPGFIRLNANFFVSGSVVRYIADAVLFVAEHGWKFLALYRNVSGTGEWRHRSDDRKAFQSQSIFDHVSFGSRYLASATMPSLFPSSESPSDVFRSGHNNTCLAQALQVVSEIEAADPIHYACGVELTEEQLLVEERGTFGGRDTASGLTWFLLPSSAVALVRSHSAQPPPSSSSSKPFIPEHPQAVEFLRELGVDVAARSRSQDSLGGDVVVMFKKGKSFGKIAGAKRPKGLLRRLQWVGARICG